MIRVLLVDDQANIRRGLRMRLALETDIEIVGEAADGEAALRMARLLAPTVVVMDVHMPIMDGIDATAALLKESAPPAVVALSFYDDERTRERALAAGAAAFVPKTCGHEYLVEAIRRAAGQDARTVPCS